MELCLSPKNQSHVAGAGDSFLPYGNCRYAIDAGEDLLATVICPSLLCVYDC